MGHCIMCEPLAESYSKREIVDLVINHVAHSGDRYGTDNVRFPTDKIFENREAAEQYINSIDKGWYDGIAVKYLDFSDVKDSSKTKDLQEKINEVAAKKKEYVAAHSVKAQKAAYIGCPECGSKLNKERLRGESCPLCSTDLRAASTLERIASFDNRINEYRKKIKAEKEKDKKKAKVMWLVKWEYHC